MTARLAGLRHPPPRGLIRHGHQHLGLSEGRVRRRGSERHDFGHKHVAAAEAVLMIQRASFPSARHLLDALAY